MMYFEGVLTRNVQSQPGLLQLPFRRYTAGDGAKKPVLFFLGGGPGISNLGFEPPAALTRDFDIVVMEYRGVGKSSIELQSPYFAKALHQLSGDLSLQSAEALRPYYAKAFRDLADQGIVFDEFSVPAIGQDLEFLREQLGYSQVYLVAHSFGTRVAMYYQSHYRDRVSGSVLFAFNPPGGFIWFPQQTQDVLARYQRDLQQKNPDLGAEFAAMLAEPQPWPTRYLGMEADPARALFVAFMLSFNTHTSGQSFNAMLGAQRGDKFDWFLLARSYPWFIRFGFNWADLFVKAYTSDCYPDLIARADQQGEGALFQSPSSVLFAGYREFERAGGSCQPDMIRQDFDRTLVVAGEYDVSTPLEQLPELPGEQLLVLENFGHGDIFYAQRGASLHLVRRYLVDGVIDASAFSPKAVPEPRSFGRALFTGFGS